MPNPIKACEDYSALHIMWNLILGNRSIFWLVDSFFPLELSRLKIAAEWGTGPSGSRTACHLPYRTNLEVRSSPVPLSRWWGNLQNRFSRLAPLFCSVSFFAYPIVGSFHHCPCKGTRMHVVNCGSLLGGFVELELNTSVAQLKNGTIP